MSALCLTAALLLTALLCFVSYVQLLYLESLRLLRREVPSLNYFRETLQSKIGLEPDLGSLTFSLIKHLSLPLTGVAYLCAFVRPDTHSGKACWKQRVRPQRPCWSPPISFLSFSIAV